jgi:hypothetical protein
MQVFSLDQAAFRAGIVRRTLERLLAEGAGPAKVQVQNAESAYSNLISKDG